MAPHLLSFFDRHTLGTAWLAIGVAIGAENLIWLQNLDVALSIAVRFVALLIGILTLALTFRKWKRGDSDK